MNIKVYKRLIELGKIAHIVKQKIKAGRFKDTKILYKYLKDLELKYGFEEAFPPLVARDTVISHLAIDPQKPRRVDQNPIVQTRISSTKNFGVERQ